MIEDQDVVNPAAVAALEVKVQELGQQAGIVTTVTPADDGTWFLLFDGMQIQNGFMTRAQALTRGLERLSMRLQGKLYGQPNMSFGYCVPACTSTGDTVPKVVYFNGDRWECEEHRTPRA